MPTYAVRTWAVWYVCMCSVGMRVMVILSVYLWSKGSKWIHICSVERARYGQKYKALCLNICVRVCIFQ